MEVQYLQMLSPGFSTIDIGCIGAQNQSLQLTLLTFISDKYYHMWKYVDAANKGHIFHAHFITFVTNSVPRGFTLTTGACSL